MRKLLLATMVVIIVMLSACHPYPPPKNGMASDDHPVSIENKCYANQ